MYLRRETLTVLTTTAASEVSYTPTVNGMLHALQYEKSTGTALSSTATVVVATETAGRTLFSAAIGSTSFTKYPRIVSFVDSTNGNASLLGTTGGGTHLDKAVAINERISLTVAASSKAGQAGTFRIDIIGGAG